MGIRSKLYHLPHMWPQAKPLTSVYLNLFTNEMGAIILQRVAVKIKWINYANYLRHCLSYSKSYVLVIGTVISKEKLVLRMKLNTNRREEIVI